MAEAAPPAAPSAPASTASASAPAATGAQDAAAAGAESGKRKAGASHNQGVADKKRRRADFAIGECGVFYTTVAPSATMKVRLDLISLLDDAAAESAEVSSGASAGLDAELAELKESGKRFTGVNQEVAKGTGFIKFGGPDAGSPGGDIPSVLVARVLEKQRAAFLSKGFASSSRLLCRVLPIDHTCKPHLKDFQELAQAVLPAHVGAHAAEPTVWALEFRARNTSTLTKAAVLKVIDEIADKKHTVNLTDPKKMILVEVSPLFCGLSIVPRWSEFKKYNLASLTTPPEARKTVPKAKPAAAAQASPAGQPAAAAGESKPAAAEAAAAAVSEGSGGALASAAGPVLAGEPASPAAPSSAAGECSQPAAEGAAPAPAQAAPATAQAAAPVPDASTQAPERPPAEPAVG